MLWRLRLVWRQHSKKRQILPYNYWSNWTGPCSAVPLSVQSSYRNENILRIGGVLGHGIDAKIFPKASEKPQTMMSENRYTSPKIDVFWSAILLLLYCQQERMRRHHFWYTRYRVPPLQSCGIAECLRSFPSAFQCPNIPVVLWSLTYSSCSRLCLRSFTLIIDCSSYAPVNLHFNKL